MPSGILADEHHPQHLSESCRLADAASHALEADGALMRPSLCFFLLALVWSSLPAQLLWPGPEPGDPTRAITLGLAMNHGILGIGFDQAIRGTPLVIGVGGSDIGLAAHIDLGLPAWGGSVSTAQDLRSEPYISAGLLALRKNGDQHSGGYWLWELGVRGWPRARRGFYVDGACGVMTHAYGAYEPPWVLPISLRLLMGFAF